MNNYAKELRGIPLFSYFSSTLKLEKSVFLKENRI